MTFAVTLIASSTPLSIVHLEHVEAFIEQNALGLKGKPVWLKEHHAADIIVENCLSMSQMKSLRALLDTDRIDVLCSSTQHRQKKLLLADMDATIVQSETLDELADKAGIKDQIVAITTRAMNGELDFHAALIERVGLLKGLPLSALEETLFETKLCDGAKELIRGMKNAEAKTVLVSGGFTFFTAAIAHKTGFDHHHGNVLNHDGEKLDGTVGEPILDKDAKRSYLEHYAQELKISLADTAAVGDGANDLPMLCAAGLGVGYRPKVIVEETILNVLKYADLTAILYAQGLNVEA
jgi:phosphoserine phosphatase